jgi:hypothetical protein
MSEMIVAQTTPKSNEVNYVIKKYKAKRLLTNGFWETLMVKRSKDGLYRVYAKVGDKLRVYRPLSRPFLTESGAQTNLEKYAAQNQLEPVCMAVLDNKDG